MTTAIPTDLAAQINYQLSRIAQEQPETFAAVRAHLLDPAYAQIHERIAILHSLTCRCTDNSCTQGGRTFLGAPTELRGALGRGQWRVTAFSSAGSFTLQHAITRDTLTVADEKVLPGDSDALRNPPDHTASAETAPQTSARFSQLTPQKETEMTIARKIVHTPINAANIRTLRYGDRLHFVAEDGHRSDWAGPRSFYATFGRAIHTSRFGPRIMTRELIYGLGLPVGPDSGANDFYLADGWTITKVTERAPVACLCGSTRFRTEMTALNRELTLGGYIVLAPGVFQHDGDLLTAAQKTALDQLHLEKIDLADEVYIVDPGGYIGDSTRAEITYAKAKNKPLHFLSQTSGDS